MKLTKAQEKNLYMWCIHQGVNLDYGKLSVCDLIHFRHSQLRDGRRYQVHCEDSKAPWSKIYDDLSPAIEKFLELKRRIKRDK